MKAMYFKKKQKKDIKIDTMSVTWLLDICLLILRIYTCKDYISFIRKYI